MKKAFLVAFGVIIISSVMIYGVNAFEKGENRVDNGTFEAYEVGKEPEEWGLKEEG